MQKIPLRVFVQHSNRRRRKNVFARFSEYFFPGVGWLIKQLPSRRTFLVLSFVSCISEEEKECTFYQRSLCVCALQAMKKFGNSESSLRMHRNGGCDVVVVDSPGTNRTEGKRDSCKPKIEIEKSSFLGKDFLYYLKSTHSKRPVGRVSASRWR